MKWDWILQWMKIAKRTKRTELFLSFHNAFSDPRESIAQWEIEKLFHYPVSLAIFIQVSSIS